MSSTTVGFQPNSVNPFGTELESKVSTGIVGSNGTYTIRVVNFTAYSYDADQKNLYRYIDDPTGIGVYTLYISCTRDGNVINPDDVAPAANGTGSTGSTTAAPAFSGVGFPGLAPVDFGGVAQIPMVMGVPMTGAVTPTGGEILGFTFDAAAGDTLDLAFNRLPPGNLNLGLVVLSADNQVVFQASLVTSSTLSTGFTLPSDGTYTIGVFRIDLLPPTAPEATAFQVTATLNP